MPVGPGKYDDACTQARLAAGLTDEWIAEHPGAGVALVVFDAPNGAGFSIQADLLGTLRLPMVLRAMADKIERTHREGEL